MLVKPVLAGGFALVKLLADKGKHGNSWDDIFGMGRNFLMRFSLNGRSFKLDFDDVQLMCGCIRTGNQDGGHLPEAAGNLKTKPAFLWSGNNRDSCSHCAMSARVVNQRWPPLTGSRCEIRQYLGFYTD